MPRSAVLYARPLDEVQFLIVGRRGAKASKNPQGTLLATFSQLAESDRDRTPDLAEGSRRALPLDHVRSSPMTFWLLFAIFLAACIAAGATGALFPPGDWYAT